jgi:cell division transport system ATP-binding protein
MLVQFEHVSLGRDPERPVLSDVNFALPTGGFTCLTGPNGSGKSSLLRLIAGMEKPAAGRIFLFGEDITHASRAEFSELRRQMGIVFQDFRLLPHLSALENVALPLRLAGVDENYIDRHARELLEWVGLDARIEAKPAELSGGERQRVALARAIVGKPKLLLADEPTGSVDDETSIRLFRLLDEMNKMGTAIIFATHRRQLAERLGHPILRLGAGRLTDSAAKAA